VDSCCVIFGLARDGTLAVSNLLSSLPGRRVARRISRRCPIFLVRAAHNDLERVIEQGPLQGLRFIPRRTHPHVALARITRLEWIGARSSPSASESVRLR
jgi:hypothetical protein